MSTRSVNPKRQQITVQGNTYVVESSVPLTGPLEGERVITLIDNNEPSFYAVEELADIYAAIM